MCYSLLAVLRVQTGNTIYTQQSVEVDKVTRARRKTESEKGNKIMCTSIGGGSADRGVLWMSPHSAPWSNIPIKLTVQTQRGTLLGTVSRIAANLTIFALEKHLFSANQRRRVQQRISIAANVRCKWCKGKRLMLMNQMVCVRYSQTQGKH